MLSPRLPFARTPQELRQQALMMLRQGMTTPHEAVNDGVDMCEAFIIHGKVLADFGHLPGNVLCVRPAPGTDWPAEVVFAHGQRSLVPREIPASDYERYTGRPIRAGLESLIFSLEGDLFFDEIPL
jgi:hypothetical protein